VLVSQSIVGQWKEWVYGIDGGSCNWEAGWHYERTMKVGSE